MLQPPPRGTLAIAAWPANRPRPEHHPERRIAERGAVPQYPGSGIGQRELHNPPPLAVPLPVPVAPRRPCPCRPASRPACPVSGPLTCACPSLPPRECDTKEGRGTEGARKRDRGRKGPGEQATADGDRKGDRRTGGGTQWVTTDKGHPRTGVLGYPRRSLELVGWENDEMEVRCAECGCLVDRGKVVERCANPECCCKDLPDKKP